MDHPSSTKTNLLNAAEALFAEQGIETTSLRAITAAAGANIASVNYHFGSKDALVQAVFSRRLAPLNAERLRRLDELEPPLTTASVLDAFIRPVIELRTSLDEGGRHFVRMMGRALFEPGSALRTAAAREFADVVRRFSEALRETRPELSHEEVLWRLQFSVGCMAFSLSGHSMLQDAAGATFAPIPDSELATRTVAFCTRGFGGAEEEPY